MCLHMYVCMYVRTYVRMPVRMQRMYVHMDVHKGMYVCVRTLCMCVYDTTTLFLYCNIQPSLNNVKRYIK